MFEEGWAQTRGTQGRLLAWAPIRLQHQKKTVSAACHDLSCRFAKEASSSKAEMLADIDFLDVTVRQETMNNVPAQPVRGSDITARSTRGLMGGAPLHQCVAQLRSRSSLALYPAMC